MPDFFYFASMSIPGLFFVLGVMAGRWAEKNKGSI